MDFVFPPPFFPVVPHRQNVNSCILCLATVIDQNGTVIVSQIYPNPDMKGYYTLVFPVTIDPLGFATYFVSGTPNSEGEVAEMVEEVEGKRSKGVLSRTTIRQRSDRSLTFFVLGVRPARSPRWEGRCCGERLPTCSLFRQDRWGGALGVRLPSRVHSLAGAPFPCDGVIRLTAYVEWLLSLAVSVSLQDVSLRCSTRRPT